MKALLTTDGSTESLEAIDRYCQLLPTGIREHVVVTVDEFQAYGIIDSVDKEEMDRLQHHHCQLHLQKAKEVLDKYGVQAQYLERAGQAASTLLDCADEQGVGMIVIGARGAGALTRVLLGSTSDSVVSHSKVSVWVVRPMDSSVHTKNPHITLCLDGSEASKHSVEFLQQLKLPSHAKLSLVAYVRRPENLPDEIVYDAKELAMLRKELESVKQELILSQVFGSQPASDQIECTVAEKVHVGHAIIEHAARHHSSLVLVGDKGRSAIARFFIGSVSRFVLHHAPCSVLIVKKSR